MKSETITVIFAICLIQCGSFLTRSLTTWIKLKGETENDPRLDKKYEIYDVVTNDFAVILQFLEYSVV